MAEASIETNPVITLTLDEEEAGYLLDLLSAHIGGGLTRDLAPLGRIRLALNDAEVERVHAFNSNQGYGTRNVTYAVLEKE